MGDMFRDTPCPVAELRTWFSILYETNVRVAPLGTVLRHLESTFGLRVGQRCKLGALSTVIVSEYCIDPQHPHAQQPLETLV